MVEKSLPLSTWKSFYFEDIPLLLAYLAGLTTEQMKPCYFMIVDLIAVIALIILSLSLLLKLVPSKHLCERYYFWLTGKGIYNC